MVKITQEILVGATGTVVPVFAGGNDGALSLPAGQSGGPFPIDDGVYDMRPFDRWSAFVEFVDSSSAVVEIRKNHTGRAGEGIAYDTAEELDAAGPTNEANDAAGVPAIEAVVTTAGAIGERATLHLYRYSTA
jgi:hypothetical protein